MSADIRQEGTVLVLSQKVGTEIDRLENEYYGIFPAIPRLVKATFYSHDSLGILCRLKYQSSGGKVTIRNVALSEKAFREKKTEIDLILPMPHNWWYVHSGEKARDDRREVLRQIPMNTWLEVRDHDKTRYRGSLRAYNDSSITIKEVVLRSRIAHDNIHKIFLLRERELDQRYVVYSRLSASAAVGGSFFYLNRHSGFEKNIYLSSFTALITFFLSGPTVDAVIRQFPYKEEIVLPTMPQ